MPPNDITCKPIVKKIHAVLKASGTLGDTGDFQDGDDACGLVIGGSGTSSLLIHLCFLCVCPSNLISTSGTTSEARPKALVFSKVLPHMGSRLEARYLITSNLVSTVSSPLGLLGMDSKAKLGGLSFSDFLSSWSLQSPLSLHDSMSE